MWVTEMLNLFNLLKVVKDGRISKKSDT